MPDELKNAGLLVTKLFAQAVISYVEAHQAEILADLTKALICLHARAKDAERLTRRGLRGQI